MLNKDSSEKYKVLNFFDLLIIYIILVSITSVLLLCFNLFSPIYGSLLGLVELIAIILLFNVKISYKMPLWNRTIFLILLLGLIFRIGPYLYVWGGQDEGIYVNMSYHYENYGSTFIKDNIREILSSENKSIYDSDNQLSTKMIKQGKYEGISKPGIYISDLSKSEYVFQFYPLHPIWMSIFGNILGGNARVYSLTFFSLISILIFALIAYELSNFKKSTAYLVSLFIAINPMMIFFSKFPVSEMVTLFFSSAGFYYLIKYYKSTIHNFVYLIISAGLFFGLFLNHISNFIYLTIFYIILLIVMFCTEDKILTKHIIIYCMTITITFILSLIYGYVFTYPYVYDVYNIMFKKFLGDNWAISLLYIIIVLIALTASIIVFRKYIKKLVLTVLPKLSYSLPFLLLFALIYALYKAYQFGFGNREVSDLLVRWELNFKGFDFITHSNIFALFLYVSPLLFIIFIIASFKIRKKQDSLKLLLLTFIFIFIVVRIVVANFTPYFYYGRYLCSELIPYILLFVSLYMGDKISESNYKNLNFKIITSLIIITSIYSIYIASFQFQGKVNEGLNAQLQRLNLNVDKNDLLILYKKNFLIQMKTTLDNFLNRDTLFINNYDELATNYNQIINKFDDIYILQSMPNNSEALKLKDTFTFNLADYSQDIIPISFTTKSFTYYLYELSKDNLNSFVKKYEYGEIIDFKEGGNLSDLSVSGWSVSEKNFTWTDGYEASLSIPIQVTKNNLVLSANIMPLTKQNVEIYINEQMIGKWYVDQNNFIDYEITIPNSLLTYPDLYITFKLPDAISPLEAGLGNDERILALAFNSVSINEVKE